MVEYEPLSITRLLISRQYLHLGRVTLRLENPEFVEAMEFGMMYARDSSSAPVISTQQLLQDLRETIEEDWDSLEERPISAEWRFGFCIGHIIGLLNPDIKTVDEESSLLEAFSCKQTLLYPQPIIALSS